MSSDWKSFFCATIKRNQKQCLVGYEIVQWGTDCAVWHRLCSGAQTVQCGTDCAVGHRLCSVAQTVQCGTDCAVWHRLCSVAQFY